MDRCIQISSPQEGAELLLSELAIRQENSLVVLLRGPLGVGKTSILKSFAGLVGIEKAFKSQSYGLIKEYPLASSKLPFDVVLHGDLYRLDAASLESLDFDFYMRGKSLAFLEWPEEFKKTKHWDLELILDFMAGTAYDSPLRKLRIQAWGEGTQSENLTTTF